MSQTPAAVETNIFALYEKELVNTSDETWKNLGKMIRKLRGYDPLEWTPVNHNLHEKFKRELNLSRLLESYPFLDKLTSRAPGNFNPYSRLQARIKLWREAYSQFNYSGSSRESQLADAFVEFEKEYETGRYDFLPQLRPMTVEEAAGLRAQTHREFRFFTRDLKDFNLSSSQSDIREHLEKWILNKMRMDK